MAGNSNFILRWEIDNATAKFIAGKTESEVFNEGGFKWIAAYERHQNDNDKGDFILRCDVYHNGPWKCEAEVQCFLIKSCGGKYPYACGIQMFNINDKVIIEFHVNVIPKRFGLEIVDPGIFAAPNDMSNVILKIGEERLHVSKEFLAVHSPVFKTLFFGEFAEKNKEEIEIKDVVYEEFLDLLHLVHFRTTELTDHMVVHILKLADQFQMEHVLKQSEKHLIQSNGFDVVKKLLLADQYRLATLKVLC
ncbi:hypothetical protein PMAYCL1PPCAC_25549 [Pristionchus mayeri]|uniref:BTB domain-containing protein n=1 Tax=Pristionchus mayeri TaxID=1317129 RepID=A0AAN5D2V8_9BILA|nr:hypothetical protein PMAYCL1PPCAC_25549 [Pristionchus mayeri]